MSVPPACAAPACWFYGFTLTAAHDSNQWHDRAFVKTFKQVSVTCNKWADAETLMQLLSDWFEDYNENAPHKALWMLTPREFIRSLQYLKCPI
ncbi:transposase [Desulfovibrio desulfuricans]|uniref:integrase core domain-containing protein n=1 Tax=Desulfovibrio desulfuricans TaxID=876 RepID=UPI00177AB959|nr:integrase core domain-containing protein [Desulfovibrio desulfuricans]MBD8894383.1 transposase [Desulfovibrio desulfuricans]